MQSQTKTKRTKLLSVIGDEDTVCGFLLAGIGEVNPHKESNYFVVKKDTPVSAIEETFKRFTSSEDIAVVIINQHVAEKIRDLVYSYRAPIPAVLEIPSKDQPYDLSQDSTVKRVRQMLGLGA
ncbi:V-type proton ATPase subunit F [Galdieria sulphuraria]|nr:V-type proton ATPase subunit F [Galdieria sulphuraria]